MPFLNRKRIAFVKIETTYGVDSAPTGAANAVLARVSDPAPIEGDTVSRDLIRLYYGNSEQLPTAIYSKVSLEVELAGSGTAGVAPAWGPLARACGCSETVLATAHAGTAVAGSTANTIKLAAAASATDDAYIGMPVRLTGGTGSGQTRTIIDYIGSTKTATVDRAWVTTPDITTTYSIDANTTYGLVSSGFEGATVYFYVGSDTTAAVLHKMLGARGTPVLELNADGIPVLKIELSGLYVAAADTTSPAVTLTQWVQPLPVNKANTPAINLHGLGIAMQSCSLDVANESSFYSLPGSSESILITDRKPKGAITFESVTVAAKDFWSIARAATLGSLVIEHGLTAGARLRITAPAVQITKPRYADKKGVAMMQADLTLLPIAGNDELFICAF